MQRRRQRLALALPALPEEMAAMAVGEEGGRRANLFVMRVQALFDANAGAVRWLFHVITTPMMRPRRTGCVVELFRQWSYRISR